MRDYELVLIVNPELGEEKIKKTIELVEKLITSLEGKIEKKTDWGKRELAYPIKKQTLGSYFLMDLKLPAKAPVKINQKLRLEEELLRYYLGGKVGRRRKKRVKVTPKKSSLSNNKKVRR